MEKQLKAEFQKSLPSILNPIMPMMAGIGMISHITYRLRKEMMEGVFFAVVSVPVAIRKPPLISRSRSTVPII
jgi:hypothetical protein